MLHPVFAECLRLRLLCFWGVGGFRGFKGYRFVASGGRFLISKAV